MKKVKTLLKEDKVDTGSKRHYERPSIDFVTKGSELSGKGVGIDQGLSNLFELIWNEVVLKNNRREYTERSSELALQKMGGSMGLEKDLGEQEFDFDGEEKLHKEQNELCRKISERFGLPEGCIQGYKPDTKGFHQSIGLGSIKHLQKAIQDTKDIELQKNLKKINDLTCIIVSHRQETLDFCDKIYEINNKNISLKKK